MPGWGVIPSIRVPDMAEARAFSTEQLAAIRERLGTRSSIALYIEGRISPRSVPDCKPADPCGSSIRSLNDPGGRKSS
jgi:hypothetical protein